MKYEYLENRNYEFFTWMVQRVFIIHEPCCLDEVKGLYSYFLLIKLLRDKNHLYIIIKGQITLTPH
jgi:hypothetical protein